MRKPNNLTPLESVYWYGWDEVVRVPELGACWEWRGPKHSAGYGNVRTKTADGRSTFVRAHRVMLAATGVETPDELHALHSCDNPPCINPKHLRMGTDAENAADKVARGRQGRPTGMSGENNPMSKISERDAMLIRAEYAEGRITQRELANKFGISQSAVSKITLDLMWRKTK